MVRGYGMLGPHEDVTRELLVREAKDGYVRLPLLCLRKVWPPPRVEGVFKVRDGARAWAGGITREMRYEM